MLSLIIKELEANEISTLKSLWCIIKVYTFCFPFLLSLNWSVTSALQTEIAQVLFGLLADLQCITPSLHTLLLQLCTKAAAKAKRVNLPYVIIANVTKKMGERYYRY